MLHIHDTKMRRQYACASCVSTAQSRWRLDELWRRDELFFLCRCFSWRRCLLLCWLLWRLLFLSFFLFLSFLCDDRPRSSPESPLPSLESPLPSLEESPPASPPVPPSAQMLPPAAAAVMTVWSAALLVEAPPALLGLDFVADRAFFRRGGAPKLMPITSSPSSSTAPNTTFLTSPRRAMEGTSVSAPDATSPAQAPGTTAPSPHRTAPPPALRAPTLPDSPPVPTCHQGHRTPAP